MGVLVTADLHLNDNPRDEYRHKFVQNTLPELVKKTHSTILMILGDLTDEKDRHSAWLVNRVASYIHELSLKCQVTIIRGNHDYMDESNPFFEFLRIVDNVNWVGAPRTLGGWLFLPHTHNHTKEWNKNLFKGISRVFTHNTFNGAVGESGRELRGIPIEALRGVHTISGDVHVPQTIDTVTYVGAPYTIDFGDRFEPRLLHLEALKLTEIAAPGPRKRLLEVSAGWFFDGKRRDPGYAKGDLVNVRLHMAMEHAARWSEIKDLVRAWGEKHQLVINQITPLVTYTKGEKNEPHTINKKSDEELLREYARLRDLDDNTIKAGLNLMKRA